LIQLRDGLPLSYVRHTMALPICPECENYVKVYLSAQLRIITRLVIALLPLTLGLIYVLLRPLNHPFAWVSWFVLGGVSAWLVASGLLQRLLPWRRVDQMLSSMTGSPPPGYTGWGSDPAQLMERGCLCFSSRGFQRAFTLLNPDLPLCVMDDGCCVPALSKAL